VASATSENPLLLLVIDIDRFKEFNDRHGHKVGDLALQEVARAMESVTPDRGAACRLGGDEFVILIPQTPVDEAKWLRGELAQEIARRQVDLEGERRSLRITASVGMALAPQDGNEAEGLFHKADMAMYAAKRCSKEGEIKR
jgi:diguanylate cyclase (GGDEF)-like protein